MRLQNRIPPPIVTLTFILLSFWLANYLPKLGFNFQGLLSLLIILIGLTIIVIGVKTFHKSDTTVNPLNPKEASHLVTDGVFSYTRNPMYLGMLIIVLGVTVYNGVYIGIIILPCFIFYIKKFQIKPEEEAMQEIFADDYTDYFKRVRRWL
tara:strand:- start:2302 stop:2754 length:453 start_codon:yes stop_codon:yes gene_type:complete